MIEEIRLLLQTYRLLHQLDINDASLYSYDEVERLTHAIEEYYLKHGWRVTYDDYLKRATIYPNEEQTW